MAKSRQQKEETLKTLKEKLAQAKSVVFASFAGLKAKEIEDLRSRVRKEGMTYTVAKKTLMKKAFDEAGVAGTNPKSLTGSIGTLFGQDEVSGAKLLDTFRKDHEALKLLGGILENKFVDAAGVLALAKLPGKQELLAKLAGTLQAPISGFVNVLAGNLRNLLNVLGAIKNNKINSA